MAENPCGTVTGGGPSGIAAFDTLRAVIIFARIPGEGEFDSCEPEGWPEATKDIVPASASDLLENPPLPLSPTWTPSNPRSLTSLFWNVSDDGTGPSNQHHVLIGEVYPEVVLCDSTFDVRSKEGLPTRPEQGGRPRITEWKLPRPNPFQGGVTLQFAIAVED